MALWEEHPRPPAPTCHRHSVQVRNKPVMSRRDAVQAQRGDLEVQPLVCW